MNDQGVDDAHLVILSGVLPGDVGVLRQLFPIEVDAAVHLTVFLGGKEGAGLQGGTGGVHGWVLAPLPVGEGDRTGVLLRQNRLVDGGDGGQVLGIGGSNHKKASFSISTGVPSW